MDYNNYNYNNNRKKNPRRVQSVQDMMNTSPNMGGYNNSARNRARSRSGSYEAPSYSGGPDSIAGVFFTILLCVCVLVSLLAYRSGHNKASYHYPLDVVTMSGVLTDIYEAKLGTSSGTYSADAGTATSVDGSTAYSETATSDFSTENAAAAATPITPATGISGAAMLLDVGGGVEGYTEAGSYSELISQLEGALVAGDATFIGSKIGYTDDATGSILGFPQSVVEHFASFMAGNDDKRQTFLDSIQDADKFSGMSGTAYVVNLPLIKYKVTTDYDSTTFSFSGFSEQTLNANQEATVSPMLPCMYTVRATCPSWAQPIEGQLEATFGENLEVNFGTN